MLAIAQVEAPTIRVIFCIRPLINSQIEYIQFSLAQIFQRMLENVRQRQAIFSDASMFPPLICPKFTTTSLIEAYTVKLLLACYHRAPCNSFTTLEINNGN